jgi:ketosteroid isomerase-like protein
MSLHLTILLVVGMLVGCSVAENGAELPATSQAEAMAVPTEAPTEAPTAPQTPTAESTVVLVQEHVARVNAGDYAGAVALMADDFMAYFIGMPPTGMEIYRGRDQYQTFLEECCTGQHFEMVIVPGRETNGMVWVQTKTWMDFTRELGVAPNSFHEIYRVEDGLITLYVSTMTKEALTTFRPALQEVMPEAFAALVPPDVSGITPATEITVNIEDGTCTFDSPMALQAGKLVVHANVEDELFDKYAVSFFTLDEDKDLLDLMASSYGPEPPPWVRTVFLRELDPGESQTYENVPVNEGLLYLVCWAQPQGAPIGNGGPFVVVP